MAGRAVPRAPWVLQSPTLNPSRRCSGPSQQCADRVPQLLHQFRGRRDTVVRCRSPYQAVGVVQDGRDLVRRRRRGVAAQVDGAHAQIAEPGQGSGAVLGVHEDTDAARAVGGRAARFAASLRGSDERTRLDAVNRFVNSRIAFVDDSRLYGVADRWSAANESLSRGRGDCEDYAIAKLAMLRRAGFADRDLYFVVLKDLSRRADHAVLVVRSGGRFLVLDNGTNQMIDSAAIQDYRPVLTFTAGQRFAHGYRRAITPPVIWASNKVRSDPAPMTLATAAGMPSSPFASR